jgi:hypothetical protein
MEESYYTAKDHWHIDKRVLALTITSVQVCLPAKCCPLHIYPFAIFFRLNQNIPFGSLVCIVLLMPLSESLLPIAVICHQTCGYML